MKKLQELDLSTLGFSYTQTPYNVRVHYDGNKWGEIEVSQDTDVKMHIASTALHYGQQVFEGLKVSKGVDGKIRLFRVEDNARRMQDSAAYLEMVAPSAELFVEAVRKVVELNADYVPDYGSDGTLYVRPVLFGVGATVGIRPSLEYMLVIFVTPVGRYFRNDAVGIDTLVDRKHDRSGAYGTGHIKAGGNYASSLKSGAEAHAKGYHSVIYLDPIEHRYIDECGAANFFAIQGKKYITPVSTSILPSITNLTLQQIAEDMGYEVERRRIDFVEEIESFDEVGACGTAAVIAPILSIYDPESDKSYKFDGPGPVATELLRRYRAIQLGEEADNHNWNLVVNV